MTGPYVTTSLWWPWEPDEWEAARGLPGWQPDPLVSEHPDLASAEVQGQRDGCMAGIRRVEVCSPDGTLQALWDKESLVVVKTRRYLDLNGRMLYDVEHRNNVWQRIGAESKALRERENAEFRDAYRAEQAHLDAQREPGSPRTSPSTTAVAARLRAARTSAPASQEGRP